MREILNHLFEHKTLTRKEAESVLTNIAKGIYSESEIAAFLTVYLMRSITVDELTGFVATSALVRPSRIRSYGCMRNRW